MTEIHAFDPDGTPSPGAQTALGEAVAGLATTADVTAQIGAATDGLASGESVAAAIAAIPEATSNERGLMSAEAVQTLAATEAVAATAERGRPSRATVDWGETGGVPYSVVRVFDAARPGVIAKSLGDGFENQQHAADFLWWAKDQPFDGSPGGVVRGSS